MLLGEFVKLGISEDRVLTDTQGNNATYSVGLLNPAKGRILKIIKHK